MFLYVQYLQRFIYYFITQYEWIWTGKKFHITYQL